MAVVLRVMWSAELGSLSSREALKSAQVGIEEWAREGFDATVERRSLFKDGELSLHAADSKTRSVKRIVLEASDSLEVVVEDSVDGGDIWRVIIRAICKNGRVYFWVDNIHETVTLVPKHQTLGRPRVVDRLLKVGEKPAFGNKIFNEAILIPDNGAHLLVEQIKDPNRLLPLIVVTTTRAGVDNEVSERASRIARRLTGLAHVAILGVGAQDALKDLLPDGFAVWGGAIRVYMPDRLEDSRVHRLYTYESISRRGETPVVNWVARLSASRRVDNVFGEIKRTLTNEDFLEIQLELEDLRKQLEEEVFERADLEHEIASLSSELRTIRSFLAQHEKVGLYYEENSQQAPVPSFTSMEEAVEVARTTFSDFLAIPVEAERELDAIDGSPQAVGWANTLWRGLMSLHDYALERQATSFSGGFWEWCQQGRGSWPASPKKLAMRESETVVGNSEWSAKRLFPISAQVRSGGKVLMEAHLKITSSGADLSPRVYFYDDTSGATGMVHVGFIGPHRLVPNTLS